MSKKNLQAALAGFTPGPPIQQRPTTAFAARGLRWVAGLSLLGPLLVGAVNAAEPADAIETYANIVHASYEDTLITAKSLDDAITTFVKTPSSQALNAARSAWLEAREPYGQTEVYRFYGGPIDGEGGPEGLLNAWPLDEAYIESADGSTSSIITDSERYPVIDSGLLISLNEAGAEENISTGYHAIEFLLWGPDTRPDGPGDRPVSDYTTDEFAARRGTYLSVAGNLLVEQLATLVAAWDPAIDDNYRAEFLAMPEQQALERIMTSLKVLSEDELAGERMYVAYDNADQEDEQSCFSDNTHRDIHNNALGIQNVYLGRYQRIDGSVIEGTGIGEIVQVHDQALDEALQSVLAESLAQVDAIPAPFDQAIIDEGSRKLVYSAINSLLDQGEEFGKAMAELELDAVPAGDES